MKKISLILTLVVFLSYSCTKESKQELTNYKEILYNPETDEQIKEEVFTFLKHTDITMANKISIDYIGRTPSEAKWVMEGASNFIKNVNLDEETSFIESSTLTLTNYIDGNGDVMVSGVEIVSNFNTLHSQIDQRELSDNLIAKLVDYEITSISSIETVISINTYYGSLSSSAAAAPDGFGVIRLLRDSTRNFYNMNYNNNAYNWGTNIFTPVQFSNGNGVLHSASHVLSHANGSIYNEIPHRTNWSGLTPALEENFAYNLYAPTFIPFVMDLIVHYNNQAIQQHELLLLELDMGIAMDFAHYSPSDPGVTGTISKLSFGRGLAY